MTVKTIGAKAGTDDESPYAEVAFDFGDNVEESADKFGGDVVHSRFVAAATVDLQALIRRNLTLEEPKSQEEIQVIVDDWKPGVSTRKRVSATEKAQRAIDNLSDAEKEALLESLLSG